MTTRVKDMIVLDWPDSMARAVGDFVMRFAFLEFQLWLWHNEMFDDVGDLESFVGNDRLGEKIKKVKVGIDSLNITDEDKKYLKSFWDGVSALAPRRNLICHNPYFSLGGGDSPSEHGAIFGIRKVSTDLARGVDGGDIPTATLADVELFATECLDLCNRASGGFSKLQSGLSPKQ